MGFNSGFKGLSEVVGSEHQGHGHLRCDFYVLWWNISVCLPDYMVVLPGDYDLDNSISSDLSSLFFYNVNKMKCVIYFYIYLFVCLFLLPACTRVCMCTCWWHLVNHEHCVPTEKSGCWLLLQEHAECLCSQFMRGISVSQIALESLDLITIVVPPALPAAMTVGRFYAQNRLQAKNVYCISPRTINVSGSIDCVCFDKVCHFSETILILNLSW